MWQVIKVFNVQNRVQIMQDIVGYGKEFNFKYKQ